MAKKKNAAAVELGRKGGLAKSAAKAEAARKNLAERWRKYHEQP